MPETRTVKGFSEVRLPLAEGDFECCTFDHSDNSPCLFSSGFLSRNLLKNSLERKQERRQKIFDFEIFCVEEYQGESGGRNSQLLPKFRVRAVMTTSIPLQGYFHPDFRPVNWRENQERKQEVLTFSRPWKP